MVSRKGMVPSCLLFSHSKLDGWAHLVDMFQEVLIMFFLLDDKGAIHIFQPKSGGSGSTESHLFKLFHVQVSHYEDDWGSDGYPFYLFIELALKRKVSIVEAEP